MSCPDKSDNNLNFANTEYQNIKAIFDKTLKNLINFAIDKIKEIEMNVVNLMTEKKYWHTNLLEYQN